MATDVRPVAASVDELLRGATHREPLVGGDGKSGVALERVTIDGAGYVLKHLHHRDDWIMRATGDLVGRPITLWRTGLLDQLPGSIDHATVGAAWEERSGGRGGAILMRDVGEWLVPEGSGPFPRDQDERFLDHMAELHAAFWGFPDTPGLFDVSTRYVWFGPRLAATELALGGTNPVPTTLVPDGWARFPTRARRSAALVQALLDDPGPLVRALAATPRTLVHGDWKAGNLGSHRDGRTILLDWALPGPGPPCSDLSFYLCLNRARLPRPKEDTCVAYREALERRGIDTGPWWERQLALCLLGTLLQFGWEKSLGDGDDAGAELDWWDRKAAEGGRLLT
ncbi:MAG: phosphotransferase [Actinomycetota bacterium]|nr:phosphotransferase [Actinomycetota bacterium]